MKFFSTEIPHEMATMHTMRIEYADTMRGMAVRVYDRFVDYVARYCARQYIREHGAALKQFTEAEMVRRRVQKAIKEIL